MIATQGKYGLYPGIMGDISTEQYWADWYEANGHSAKKRHRISNHQAGRYAKDLELFVGSNLHSEITSQGWYVVFSYEWYPIRVWSNETGWIGVLEPYSSSTGRHIRVVGMYGVPLYSSGILRWMLDIDPGKLPKPVAETGKHVLSVQVRQFIQVNPNDSDWEASKWFEVLQIPDSHHYYPMMATQVGGHTGETYRHKRGSKCYDWLSIKHYRDIVEQIDSALVVTGSRGDIVISSRYIWRVVKRKLKQGATNDEEKNTHQPACDTQGQSARGKEPLHHCQDV